MARYSRKRSSRIRHGRTFRSRRGILGRYKYINGRRVAFVPIRRARHKRHHYRRY